MARVTAIVEAQQRTIRRRLHPVWLGLMLTAAGLMGASIPQALDFMGITTTGPGLAAQVMNARVDSVEIRQARVEGRLDTMSVLFTRYIASNCLDTAQVVRLRQALVPCAKLVRDQGVTP